MGSKLVESTLALVGGIGFGAAVMYLFDPDLGTHRRRDIRSAASDAVDSTTDAAHATVHQASSSAKTLAGKVSDYAHHLADELSGKASGLSDKAGDYVGAAGAYASRAKKFAKSLRQSAGDSASDAVSTGQSYVRGSVSRAKDAGSGLLGRLHDRSDAAVARGKKTLGVKEPHPVATTATVTIGTVSVLAMGAGLMYFLDPKQGKARREWVRDGLFNVTRQPVERAKAFGRQANEQVQGYVAQARDAVQSKLDEARVGRVNYPANGASAEMHD